MSNKEYRENHPDRAREQDKRYRQENQNKIKKDKAEYYERNKARLKEQRQANEERLRVEVLTHYSSHQVPRCTNIDCPEHETPHLMFLQLDHINEDGGEDRRAIGRTVALWRHLKKLGFPDGYQVLCANCNIEKAIKHRSTDHNKKKHLVKLKTEVLSHYSNGNLGCSSERCPNRATSNINILCLDHTAGDGADQRRIENLTGHNLYRRLKQDGYPVGYQVLCFNCNTGKKQDPDWVFP